MPTVELNPLEFSTESRELAQGDVPVVISLSAYDIPSAVTLKRDPESGTLRISFDYVDREAAVTHIVDDALTVQLGKSSGKVLGFILKPTAQRPKDITIRIVEGVEKQLARAQRDNQRLNYEFIKRVVQNKMESLLAAT